MATESKTLDNLFHDTLQDVSLAEHTIVATLPSLNGVAGSRLRAPSTTDAPETAAPTKDGELKELKASLRYD